MQPPPLRWFCLLALFLLFLAPNSSVAEEPEGVVNRWNDPEFLRSLVGPACDAIEELQDAKYPKRPELVFSTRKELTELLIEEMGTVLRHLGATDDASIRETARSLSGALAAKYAPATNVIHVLLKNVEHLTEILNAKHLRTEGVMRMLITHECAHALDFQRYPGLEQQRQSRESADGIQAVGAIIEGHAQWVTEKVAARWGAQADFQAFTGFVTHVSPVEDAAERLVTEVLAAEVRFAYVQGHRFFSAVEKARGTEGVAKALAEPPAETRLIENPDQYLSPGDRVALDSDAFLKAMRAGADASWTQQVVPLKKAQVRAALGILPAETLDPLMEGYMDGIAWVGTLSTGTQVIAAYMQWTDEVSSARYLRDVRQLHELKDATFKAGSVVITGSQYLDGVGLGARYPGLRAIKSVHSAAGDQSVVVHHAIVGKFAVELTFVEPDGEAVSTDDWMERALVVVGVPAPEAAAVK